MSYAAKIADVDLVIQNFKPSDTYLSAIIPKKKVPSSWSYSVITPGGQLGETAYSEYGKPVMKTGGTSKAYANTELKWTARIMDYDTLVTFKGYPDELNNAKNRLVEDAMAELYGGLDQEIYTIAHAATASDSGSYWHSGTGGFDQILKDCDAKKEVFRAAFGIACNTLFAPANVIDVLHRAAMVSGLMQYATSEDWIKNGGAMPNFKGLNVTSCEGYYNTAVPGATASWSPIWASEEAYFAYIDPNPATTGVLTNWGFIGETDLPASPNPDADVKGAFEVSPSFTPEGHWQVIVKYKRNFINPTTMIRRVGNSSGAGIITAPRG